MLSLQRACEKGQFRCNPTRRARRSRPSLGVFCCSSVRDDAGSFGSLVSVLDAELSRGIAGAPARAVAGIDAADTPSPERVAPLAVRAVFVEPAIAAPGAPEQTERSALELIAFMVCVALDADAAALVALVVARGTLAVGVTRRQAVPRDQIATKFVATALIGLTFDAPVRRRITPRAIRGAAVGVLDALEAGAASEITAQGRDRAIGVDFASR